MYAIIVVFSKGVAMEFAILYVILAFANLFALSVITGKSISHFNLTEVLMIVFSPVGFTMIIIYWIGKFGQYLSGK